MWRCEEHYKEEIKYERFSVLSDEVRLAVPGKELRGQIGEYQVRQFKNETGILMQSVYGTE